MKSQRFCNTIRFKLTLWYSLLLLVVSFFFVIGINMVVTQYYKMDPEGPTVILFAPKNPFHRERWEQLPELQREFIREIRREDLEKVRVISLYSFIPLTAFSFIGGYIIADRMLSPLKELNKKINSMTAKNLHKKISFKDSGDEISEIIKSFNFMTSRLKESFDNQKQFVENASHELKTPLTIIRTNLEALKDNIPDPKKKIGQYLVNSDKASIFMNNLIEDLLLLSLLENHIQKTKVAISEIVKEAISQSKILAYKRNTKIKLELVNTDLKTIISANETLLQRAVMNVLENAIKYSPRNSVVEVIVAEYKSSIKIRIQDKGIGISKSNLKKIFYRFYRVDKSRSRKTGGSGLGLAISKKILELHNGTITVISRESKGSTFTISLPY